MVGLHVYRRRLVTVAPGRVRLWAAGVGVFWIALCAVTVLHVLWFLFVHNGVSSSAVDGGHFLWWVTLPLMVLGGGTAPLILVMSCVRIARA
jgi:hypothetical protein